LGTYAPTILEMAQHLANDGWETGMVSSFALISADRDVGPHWRSFVRAIELRWIGQYVRSL
jgi:hypothetical protein